MITLMEQFLLHDDISLSDFKKTRYKKDDQLSGNNSYDVLIHSYVNTMRALETYL